MGGDFWVWYLAILLIVVSVFYPTFELSDAVLLLMKTAVIEQKPVEIPSLTLCVDPLLMLFTRDVIAQGCQCARVVRYLHSCIERSCGVQRAAQPQTRAK